MKTLKNKIAAIAIATFFILSMTASVTLLPNANAHTPALTYPTWSYVAISPSPTGVGQTVTVVWWLSDVPPTATGSYGDRWNNVTITVTKPDGTTQTLGPFSSDPVGGGYTLYTPETTGTYYFQMNFPGQTIAGANPPPVGNYTWYGPGNDYIGDYYAPSISTKEALTVQQAQVSGFSYAPLPNNYWTTPIDAENRGWYTISGDWLSGVSPVGWVNSYTPAVDSAHIVWTKPIWFGGMAGGTFGNIPYYDGLSYESPWTPPIIMNGRLYYNEMALPRDQWYCVNLYTGQTEWVKNITGPIQTGFAGLESYPQMSFGQEYDYSSPNQYGVLPYIWSSYTGVPVQLSGNAQVEVGQTTIWSMYDAFTGDYILSIDNVPAGVDYVAPDGSLLVYVYDNSGWLACWNSSYCIWDQPSTGAYLTNQSTFWGPTMDFVQWAWRPNLGQTIDGNYGYSWNVTAPPNLTTGGYVTTALNDTLIGVNGIFPLQFSTSSYSVWALSLQPGSQGHLLWQQNYNSPPIQNATMEMGPADPSTGVFVMGIKETAQLYGYSLATGEQVWGPTQPEVAFNTYSIGEMSFGNGIASCAYGNLYVTGYGGVLYCYNMKTGNLLWNYTSPSSPDIPYPNYPLNIGAIADGKVYLYSTEHSPTKPYWPGSSIRCVDASSGDELWSVDTWANPPTAIADGYLVTLNSYDNEIECFGKGLSATTVTTAPAINNNKEILLSGTVTDQSPGQTCVGIPAAGTPAISDASMSAWMEYLYMSQPKPSNATGVPVTLSYVDPNGNYYVMGNTTSDINGQYKYVFTPTVPGTYTVTATFEGSNSYYSSTAETSVVFDSPSTTTAPTTTPTSVADMYFMPAITGLFVLIIIVAIVLVLLMLRKRP
ncbi:MAG: PQQ-binding-like beta-propeller repeat protein [Candidatus Bathyarchaeia archaeon]